MSRKKSGRFCPGCGEPMEAGARFCPACGRKIGKGKGTTVVHSSRGNPWKWVAIFSIGAAILFVAIFSGIRKDKEKDIYAAHNTAQIASIVSEFDCSCGQCDKTLANCDCPTAKDTYAYISDLVNKGKFSRKEVLQMVNQRYGHYTGEEPLTG